MSAPNKSYDPVEVEALNPDEIARMRDEALAAIAAAGDLDALGEVKLAHAGDRSPLALANREIGALPPHAKAEAGKRVGQARGAVSQALDARQAELEAERDAAGAGRGGRRRHAALRPRPGRRPAPADHAHRSASSDLFVAMGYEVAEGPEVEAEWFNFDALNFPPGPPGARRCRTPSSSSARRAGDGSGVVLRTHTSPVQIRSLLEPRAAGLRRSARAAFPHRRAGRHAHPGLPPDRGAGRRRGHHHGPPARAPSTTSSGRCSARA